MTDNILNDIPPSTRVLLDAFSDICSKHLNPHVLAKDSIATKEAIIELQSILITTLMGVIAMTAIFDATQDARVLMVDCAIEKMAAYKALIESGEDITEDMPHE